MTNKFDINILKEIFSYINIYKFKLPYKSDNIEKSVCMLMLKTNNRKRKLWINEFRSKLAKLRHEENQINKLKNTYKHLVNHIKFIFSHEDIKIPDNKMNYINYNIMYFTIIISNYGSFNFTIINVDTETKIYINDIVEPEHILDDKLKIDPDDYKNIEILDDEYYVKKIHHEGNIEEIIHSIWFTPFWAKRMPSNKDYIIMN
jgi:hypothetical protein